MHLVQDGRQIGARTAGDIMDHIAAFFDARIAALTVRYQRNRPVLVSRHGVFLGLSRNLALGAGGSMNCGCASICRCFCLFAQILSARAHRPWSGTSGLRHSLQSLPPPQVELTSSHTAAPLARRAGGIGGAERNRRLRRLHIRDISLYSRFIRTEASIRIELILFGESHLDWLPVRGGESGDLFF